MNRFERVKALFEGAHIGYPPGAQIQSGFGTVGDDVAARAAFDDVGVDGDAAAQIVPFFDTGDLCGKLVNGVDASLRGQTRVRGATVDDELGFPDTFA